MVPVLFQYHGRHGVNTFYFFFNIVWISFFAVVMVLLCVCCCVKKVAFLMTPHDEIRNTMRKIIMKNFDTRKNRIVDSLKRMCGEDPAIFQKIVSGKQKIQIRKKKEKLSESERERARQVKSKKVYHPPRGEGGIFSGVCPQ